jgi:hypothetical protein
MSKLDERQALEEVCQRLGTRFPHLPAAQVRATVEQVHARFDGPVRDYVPLLVEREARAQLTAMGRRGEEAHEEVVAG